MNFAFSSPLKAVQGSAIKDLTAAHFELPKFGRSQQPRQRLSDLSHLYPPLNSSKLSTVSLPAKPQYFPNQTPPKVHSSRPNDADSQQSEGPPKVIIRRFLLVDGNISFLLGSSVDGVIAHDAEEVPLAKILEHVSPAELERFENQDFFDEDERERLLPPKKPRGRPRRRDDILLPSLSVGPSSNRALPEVSVVIHKRVGRPKGTFKKRADSETSLTGLSTAIRKRRGRPPLQKTVSVVIPSFNGPQPHQLDAPSSAQSKSDGHGDAENSRPQYSMLTASGLGQSDTEDVTSRDQSVERVPPSLKKRGLDARTAFINPDSTDGDDETASNRIKRVRRFSETSPDPIADDSIALLRQFEAQIYGPGPKSSIIPHRNSKPSANFGGSHDSPGLPSFDSAMGPVQQPLAQSIRSKSPSNESLPQNDPKPKIPQSYLQNSFTVFRPHQHNPTKTTPTRPTSPPRVISRKVSLTPHFPPSTSVNQSKTTTDTSAKNKSQHSIPSANGHLAPKQSNTKSTQPYHHDSASPTRRNQSASVAPGSSKVGFAGLPRAKSITDYFAPKPTASIPSPPPLLPPPSHAPPSPTSQLLGAWEEDSEDQLAREPLSSSSADSLNSQIVTVRPSQPSPPATTIAAAAMSRKSFSSSSSNSPLPDQEPSPSTSHSPDSSEREETDDEHQAGRHHLPTITVPPTKFHSSSNAFRETYELEEDDVDNDEDDEDDDNDDTDNENDNDENDDELEEEEEEKEGSNSDSDDSIASEIIITRQTYT